MLDPKLVAKKKWGQNFLKDTDAILDFISALNPQPNNRVLEIGPGLGALTEYLVANVGFLKLVEIDPDFFQLLTENLGTHENVEIINRDVMELNLEELVAKDNITKVIGSLPYNISKQIVAKFCMDPAYSFNICVFMLQKEVAHDYLADKNKNSFLHAWLSIFNDMELVLEVEKSKFVPQPKVDSTIIKFKRKPAHQIEIDIAELPVYQKFLRNLFLTPRKKLLKNLKNIYPLHDWGKIFAQLELADNIRVEQLSDKQILQLFRSFNAGR